MRALNALTVIALLAISSLSGAAHAAVVYSYRSENYTSQAAAEEAMRAYNAPWGADLKLCTTDLSANWARFNYCTDDKPGTPLAEGFYIAPNAYNASCAANANPILGYRCNTEAEAVERLREKIFVGSCYSKKQAILSGGYADPPTSWTTQAYYEGGVLQFRYTVTTRSNSQSQRTVKFDWESCDGNSQGTTSAFNIEWNTYHGCPAGYNHVQAASGIWPNVCRAGKDAIIKLDDAVSNSYPNTCHPCVPATGEKLLFETDFQWGGYSFTRTYRSMGEYPSAGALSEPWTHNWSQRLKLPATSTASAFLWDERNDYEEYKLVSGSTTYRPANDSNRSLEKQADGTWQLTIGNGTVHTFDNLGRLQRIAQLDGSMSALNFGYGADGWIATVTDDRGRNLTFKYIEGHYADPANGAGWTPTHLDRIEDAAGLALVAYTYAPTGLLTAVTYPDGKSRVYHYAQANHLCVGAPTGCDAAWFASHLTGVTSEDGVRLSDYYFDGSGRAVRSVHAGDVNDTALTYVSDTRTLISRPGRADEHYDFETSLYRRPLSRQQLLSDGSVATSESWQYDANNLWRRHTDAKGVSTKWEFDSRGLEAKRIEAEGRAETRSTLTTWGPGHLPRPIVVEVRDAANQAVSRTSFTYNARGQALSASQIDPVSAIARTTTTTYCEQPGVDAGTCPRLGLVTSVDGPRSDAADLTTYAYYPSDDATCATAPTTCPHRKGDLWKVTDALGHVTETLKYDGNGRVLSVKDANGVITDFEYHPRGWLTARKVRGPDGASEADDAITQMAYYPTSLISSTTLPDGSFTSYVYDAAHRLTDIVDADGNTIHYTLDNAGSRTKEEVKGETGTLKRTLSRVYNQLGQLQTQKDAGEHPTGFTYDANGNADTTTDALGRVTDNDRDPLNRLAKTIQDVGGIAAQTQFRYDARDHLTEVIDPKGLTTSYGYNAYGDLTRLESPDTGISTYGYDAAGNRTSALDARNEPVSYSYDALNRLTGITYGDTALNVGYVYDAVQSDCAADEAFAIGRLTRINDGTGSTKYCYDRFGNLTSKVQVTNGQTFAVRYAYTKIRQLSAITYPDGTTVDYVRDGLGRTTEVGVTPGGGARQVLLHSATYYPFGPTSGWTFGNGRTLTRTLDLDYRRQAIRSTGTGAGGLNLGYGWDAAGNLASVHTADLALPPRITFDYDTLNRLTAFRDGPTGIAIESYSYDATGNRTSFTNAGGMQAYGYPIDSHRLASVNGIGRGYDAAGNTTSIGGTAREFAYNAAGRMSQVERDNAVVMQYAYNGKGEQVRKYLGTGNAYTVYDESGRWIGDYDNAGAPLQQAIWLDDLPVGVIASNQLHYVESDALGTPRAVIEPQRDVAVWNWDLASEAFGNSAPTQDPDGDSVAFQLDMRFPGQRYDAASGLNYNYFRDYEPGVGRYVQSDPIGLGDGPATYAYVGSAPVSFADPSGKSRRAAASTYPSSYIEIARQEAVAKLQRCNIDDCAPNNPYKISKAELQQVIQKVISADISYDPEEQVCGWSVPNSDPYGVVLGATLRIKGKCCPLASVIAHEAAHLVFGHPFDVRQQTTNEGKARFVQEQCFGCSKAFH